MSFFRTLTLVVISTWAHTLPAMAEPISWRATSVQGPRSPGLNTRIGVAMFGHGEPAIYERRVTPAGMPSGGRMDIQVETHFRFGDGSTLVMRSRETIAVSAQGQHGRDEWTGQGEIVSGTNRFSGATGRFSFRAVTGLDATADGMLGDSFLSGEGDLQRPAR